MYSLINVLESLDKDKLKSNKIVVDLFQKFVLIRWIHDSKKLIISNSLTLDPATVWGLMVKALAVGTLIIDFKEFVW